MHPAEYEIMHQKFVNLPDGVVLDHIASFDSSSDLGPESRKQSGLDEHLNQAVFQQLLVSESKQCFRPQRSSAALVSAHTIPSCSSRPKMATTFVDVACQCDSDDFRCSDSPSTTQPYHITTKRAVVSFGSPILEMHLPDVDSEGTPLLPSSSSPSRCDDAACTIMTPECSRRTFDSNLDSKVVVRRVKIAKTQPTLSRSASDSRVGHKIVVRSQTTSWRHQCSTATELNRLTADIAAENPDMVHFQQVLNTWIRAQTGSRVAAFLLVSKECNSCFCQVCNNELLSEPIYCGSADVLLSLFSTNEAFLDSGKIDQPSHGVDTEHILADISTLNEEFRGRIRAILQYLSDFRNNSQQPNGTLFLIQGRSDFVAGLVLIHKNERSVESERHILMPHLHLISTLLSIVANIEEQKRLARQSEVFLSMAQNVFSSLQDMNLLVRNITKEAKTLVHAEICSLFLLDRENSELVAEVFEKNGSSDEYLTEIRMPISLGIVGQVASTGKMMNVKEAYSHPSFYPKVDERTGFVTRNILCFPIKDSAGNLVGVAELCNKIGKPAFTKHDEQIAMTFAVYCAISISHCLLYRKLQEAHRRSHMAAELLVQGSALSIAPEDILRLTVGEIPATTSFHPRFTQFSFFPRSIGSGDTYVEAALAIFKELGLIQRFRLQRGTLARFLLMVQKGYRDVPYHNWSHAFAVAHFTYLLIRTERVRNSLSDLERLSLYVASLCHDIDHRGTNNAFQLQSRTPLAQLYSSEGSVLERHHFAQTVSILNMEECNIFISLTRRQYQSVLDYIREIILATDIANHLRKVHRIKEMVEAGFDPSSSDHRYLLLCLLMTSADLSDQSKDFESSKAIAESIYKEFFSQGDLEKQMGNRPLEMMDRDRACVPKIQIEFMDTVAVPVFEYLAKIVPESKPTCDSMIFNRKCWQVLDEILKEEDIPTLGLDYLRDAILENKVLKRTLRHDSDRKQASKVNQESEQQSLKAR